MGRADAGMQFWLRYVEHAGGLWEDAGDTAIVVVPDSLRQEFQHGEDMVVTADPDVARDEGATLLLAGHPLLMQAAETVLGEGDCGLLPLPRPPGPVPGTQQLVAAAREQFPVDHGRIDAAGGVTPGIRPMLRVGALVTFALSSDVNFQEQQECWVDIPSCRELPRHVVVALSRFLNDRDGERGGQVPRPAELVPALRYAHEQVDRRAAARAADLSRQIGDDHTRETERAVAYYDEVLHSLRRRLDTATPERAATLNARMTATRAERERRLAEITEKYRSTHTIRPFRLQVLEVPVLCLPVDIRRGERRYPLTLEWSPHTRTFAGVRCPGCRSTAPLVAAKTRLGCRLCLAKPDAQPGRAPAQLPAHPNPPVPAPTTSVQQGPQRTPVAPRRSNTPTTRVPRPDPAPSAQATRKAGRKLAESLWELATAGDRRVRRRCAPRSPADALHELFGPAGALRAVGLDAGELPRSMSSSESTPAPGGADMLLIAGEVETADRSYGYQLCWRFTEGTPLIEELTPFPAAYWPRLPETRYAMFFPAARQLYKTTPGPRVRLDPVADALWHCAVAMHGLPLTLRCVAAWWRLADRNQLLRAHSPELLAAAIDRMVSYRAGASGRYADAAAAYRVDPDEVRAVNDHLQRRLQLSASRPW